MKATFSRMEKVGLLYSRYSQELWKSLLKTFYGKIVWGSTSPNPPRKRGYKRPLLIQSVTLFKPAGYFNFY